MGFDQFKRENFFFKEWGGRLVCVCVCVCVLGGGGRGFFPSSKYVVLFVSFVFLLNRHFLSFSLFFSPEDCSTLGSFVLVAFKLITMRME